MSYRGTQKTNIAQQPTKLVPQLHETEVAISSLAKFTGKQDKINQFKADVESSSKAELKAQQRVFEEKSTALFDTLNQKPISNHPRLPEVSTTSFIISETNLIRKLILVWNINY